MGRVWKTKICIYLCSLALVFSCLNNSSSDCFPICNSSCTAAVEDETELVMDEWWKARLMMATKPITSDAFKPKVPFCNAAVYGSCIGPDGKYYKRSCEYKNLCKR